VDLRRFISRIEFTINAQARRIRLRREPDRDDAAVMFLYFYVC
jgi:hypothetical protein